MPSLFAFALCLPLPFAFLHFAFLFCLPFGSSHTHTHTGLVIWFCLCPFAFALLAHTLCIFITTTLPFAFGCLCLCLAHTHTHTTPLHFVPRQPFPFLAFAFSFCIYAHTRSLFCSLCLCRLYPFTFATFLVPFFHHRARHAHTHTPLPFATHHFYFAFYYFAFFALPYLFTFLHFSHFYLFCVVHTHLVHTRYSLPFVVLYPRHFLFFLPLPALYMHSLVLYLLWFTHARIAHTHALHTHFAHFVVTLLHTRFTFTYHFLHFIYAFTTCLAFCCLFLLAWRRPGSVCCCHITDVYRHLLRSHSYAFIFIRSCVHWFNRRFTQLAICGSGSFLYVVGSAYATFVAAVRRCAQPCAYLAVCGACSVLTAQFLPLQFARNARLYARASHTHYAHFTVPFACHHAYCYCYHIPYVTYVPATFTPLPAITLYHHYLVCWFIHSYHHHRCRSIPPVPYRTRSVTLPYYLHTTTPITFLWLFLTSFTFSPIPGLRSSVPSHTLTLFPLLATVGCWLVAAFFARVGLLLLFCYFALCPFAVTLPHLRLARWVLALPFTRLPLWICYLFILFILVCLTLHTPRTGPCLYALCGSLCVCGLVVVFALLHTHTPYVAICGLTHTHTFFIYLFAFALCLICPFCRCPFLPLPCTYVCLFPFCLFVPSLFVALPLVLLTFALPCPCSCPCPLPFDFAPFCPLPLCFGFAFTFLCLYFTTHTHLFTLLVVTYFALHLVLYFTPYLVFTVRLVCCCCSCYLLYLVSLCLALPHVYFVPLPLHHHTLQFLCPSVYLFPSFYYLGSYGCTFTTHTHTFTFAFCLHTYIALPSCLARACPLRIARIFAFAFVLVLVFIWVLLFVPCLCLVYVLCLLPFYIAFIFILPSFLPFTHTCGSFYVCLFYFCHF